MEVKPLISLGKILNTLALIRRLISISKLDRWFSLWAPLEKEESEPNAGACCHRASASLRYQSSSYKVKSFAGVGLTHVFSDCTEAQEV